MLLERLNEKVFSIADDSGYLALVNADKYNSFVGHDWNFESLQQRFSEQAKEFNIMTWPTGGEGSYNVAVLRQSSDKTAFKEFRGEVKVTTETLYLTNYEDLSLVAQFQDEKLPAKHNAELVISLPNGIYNVQVRQIAVSESMTKQNDITEFEIVLTVRY